MSWLQLTFEANRDDAQRLSEALEECGAVSVSLEGADAEPLFELDWQNDTPIWQRARVIALFPEDTDLAAVQAALAQWLGTASAPACRSEIIPDQDWVRVWMDRWQPMHFGGSLWVVPSWLSPPHPEAVNIILDPGLAFGTGTHATTALCLEWLATHPPRDLDIIDYGCGSGILAIAALGLGARHALGTDTDPQALTVARENAERNGVSEQLRLCLPDALPADSRADVVLANILAGPLIALAAPITACVKPDGILILSGLLAHQADEVEAAYAAHFRFERRLRDGWAMLAGKRRPAPSPKGPRSNAGE